MTDSKSHVHQNMFIYVIVGINALGTLDHFYLYVAGRRLLDHCPPAQSCGTEGAMWSNASTPDTVGEVKLMNVYVSGAGGCQSVTYNLGVVKCSNAPHDLVYRHEGDSTCNRGYCGMV